MATVITFGLEVTGAVQLSIFGPTSPTGKAFPSMAVTTGTSTKSYAYDASQQRWAIGLTAGKYVIRIDEQLDPTTGLPEPLDGGVVALASGGDASSKAVFVSRPKLADGSQPIVARATPAAGSDPKDPWPPPADSAACDEAWFKAAFDAQPKVTARTREG